MKGFHCINGMWGVYGVPSQPRSIEYTKETPEEIEALVQDALTAMWGVYGVPSQPPPPPRKPVVSGERLARECKRCKSHRVHAAIRPETTEMIAICKLCGHEADL